MTTATKRPILTILAALFLSLMPIIGFGTPALSSAVSASAPLPLASMPARAALQRPHITALVTGAGGEVTSLRTQDSRTYQSSNGTYKTVVYPGPVSYKDSQGAWQSIDTTLVPSTDARFARENKAGTFKVRFPSDVGKGAVRVESANRWVEFSLGGMAGAGAALKSHETYGIQGASIKYTVANSLLKESIVLASPTSPTQFVYALKTSSGLTAHQRADGGIAFVDRSGKSTLSMPAPFMTDGTGESHPVTMRLGKRLSGMKLTVSADKTWLDTPGRRFPVTVDPSVTFNNSSSGSQDACLDQDDPTLTACGTGDTTSLRSGYDSDNAPYHALLQFGTSSIPSNARVLDGEMGLYLTSSTPPAGGTASNTPIGLYPLTNSFSASGATWNSRDGTNSWTTAGGDFTTTNSVVNNCVNVGTSCTTPSGPCTAGDNTCGANCVNANWVCFFPTQLVQNWVNGTVANDGVLLKEPTENVYNVPQFDFFEFANQPGDSGFSPYLTVEWQAWTGALPYYTFESRGLADSMWLSVNVANGNFLVNNGDLTQNTIFPLAESRTYNNFESNISNDVGNGWTFSEDAFNIWVAPFDDGTVEFHGPSGFYTVFANDGTGTLRSREIEATLVSTGSGAWTMTDNASGTQLKFSGNHLSQELDRSGNHIDLTYSSSQMTSITDVQGNTNTFAHSAPVTSQYVSQITDPSGRTYQYSYDTNWGLTTYTDPNSKQTLYGYDYTDPSNPNLTSITDPNGNVTTIAYDSSRRVSSITRPLTTSGAPCGSPGCATTFTYNSGNTVVTDSNSHATTYYYDALGRVTSVLDPGAIRRPTPGMRPTITWQRLSYRAGRSRP